MGPSDRLLQTLRQINPENQLIDERRGLVQLLDGIALDIGPRRLMDISRIANHSPLFAFKAMHAGQIGLLNRNGLTTTAQEFLAGEASEADLLSELAGHTGLGPDAVRAELLRLLRMGMVEFHPTDQCNCDCSGCVFSLSAEVHSLQRRVFPFSELDIIRHLQPKSMILVGGGEPTIYRDGPYRFGHLVEKLSQCMPGIRYGLVTNGVIVPDNVNWHAFDWVRISLGAMDCDSYAKRKGVDRFADVLENALRYLRNPIPSIVFNYMINRNTFDQCLDFVRFIYSYVNKHVPQHIRKCSIHFRALIFPPNLTRQSNRTVASEGLDVSPEQIEEFQRRMIGERLSSDEADFIVSQTNLEDCLQGTRSHNPAPFSYCSQAMLFGQIRANGDVQPCNVRSDDAVVRLGDLRSQESLTRMAVKQFQVFFKQIEDDLCDASNCRRHGKNRCLTDMQTGIDLCGLSLRTRMQKKDLLAEYAIYDKSASGPEFFF